MSMIYNILRNIAGTCPNNKGMNLSSEHIDSKQNFSIHEANSNRTKREVKFQFS